ncbi:MAG: 3-dehydroquinate synthase [Chlamydiia bacterium]
MQRSLVIYSSSVKSHLTRLQKKKVFETEFYLEILGDESDKSITTYLRLVDFLMEQGFQKGDLLIAIGGGALLDLVGFVASTFMRGVEVVFIPTTLLAMVDASIGGKNGINHEKMKNCLGTIYLPKETVIDLEFLETLPLDQMLSGFVEMVKIAAIENGPFLSSLTFPPTSAMIEKARKIKEAFVKQDLQEKGVRALLNFGHTIGHALEVLSDYKMLHGQAVQHGIKVEMRLLNLDLDWIDEIEKKLPWSIPIPQVDLLKLRQVLLTDKKNRGGKVGVSNIHQHQGVDFVRFFEVDELLIAYEKVLSS